MEAFEKSPFNHARSIGHIDLAEIRYIKINKNIQFCRMSQHVTGMFNREPSN